MPKYHTSLTPVTLFLLRTCLYFQILYQHSFISHKCLKLNICKTEFGLLFSNQTLPSVLSQPRESAFISIFFQDGSFDYPLDLAHSLTDLNLITQHNFLKFFRDISQVWLVLLSALSWSYFKCVYIILSNYFSNLSLQHDDCL